jgi:hypothetical protein
LRSVPVSTQPPLQQVLACASQLFVHVPQVKFDVGLTQVLTPPTLQQSVEPFVPQSAFAKHCSQTYGGCPSSKVHCAPLRHCWVQDPHVLFVLGSLQTPPQHMHCVPHCPQLLLSFPLTFVQTEPLAVLQQL